MENIQLFNYEGNSVTFKNQNGEIFVNATEMAKPFGKRVNNFLRSDQTIEFLQVLENEHCANSRNAVNQLVTVINGGLNPGTWLHEDVALEFARWLSPTFSLWCNRKIKELLQTGQTSLSTGYQLPDFTNPAEAARAWAEQFEKRALAEKRAEESESLLAEAIPFVEFALAVSDTSDLIDIGQFAKLAYDQTKIGRNGLFKLLRNKKILMRGANQNVPYQSYIDKGWFKTIEQTFSTPYGTKVSVKTLVTGKGQIALIEWLKKELDK